ncbi:hypothetical protein MTO96_025715 [Rhipicephalus appendiculatus]
MAALKGLSVALADAPAFLDGVPPLGVNTSGGLGEATSFGSGEGRLSGTEGSAVGDFGGLMDASLEGGEPWGGPLTGDGVLETPSGSAPDSACPLGEDRWWRWLPAFARDAFL